MELQWPLILFTFFVCLSAGILFMQGLLSFLGKAKELQFSTLLTSGIMLVVGGIAVFLHLEHWERIFNGFGHITSGITQELIGVILMGITIIAFWLLERREEDHTAPKWITVVAMIVPIIMVVVMGHSYNMAARPAWDSVMLLVYYLVNMVLLGSLAVLIIAAVRGQEDAFDTCAVVALVAGIAQLIALIVYAVVLRGGNFVEHGFYFDPTLPDIAVTEPDKIMAGVLNGALAVPFWLGGVICGAVVPAICAFLARAQKAKKSSVLALAVIGFIGAVIGSFAWRAILYIVASTVFAIF